MPVCPKIMSVAHQMKAPLKRLQLAREYACIIKGRVISITESKAANNYERLRISKCRTSANNAQSTTKFHTSLPTQKVTKFYLESMTAMKNLPLKCVYLTCNNPHQTLIHFYLLPPHPHCPLSSSVL